MVAKHTDTDTSIYPGALRSTAMVSERLPSKRFKPDPKHTNTLKYLRYSCNPEKYSHVFHAHTFALAAGFRIHQLNKVLSPSSCLPENPKDELVHRREWAIGRGVSTPGGSLDKNSKLTIVKPTLEVFYAGYGSRRI